MKEILKSDVNAGSNPAYSTKQSPKMKEGNQKKVFIMNEFLAYRSREIDRIEQRKCEAERNKLFEIKEQTDQKQ